MHERSSAVRTLLYFNFIFSVCVSLCWCTSCANLSLPSHSPTAFLTRGIPEYQLYAEAQAWAGIFASFALIVGSAWPLQGFRGARLLCLFYSVYTIISQLVGLYVSVAYVQPALAAHERKMNLPPGHLSQSSPSAVIWIVITSHAILMLAVMLRYDDSTLAGKLPPEAPTPPAVEPTDGLPDA